MKDNNDKCMVYGIDISKESMKTASDLNKKYVESGKVILDIGDVAHLKFKDNFFDLVSACQTHIYWDELEKGLSECYRVLTKDGILLITCEIDKINYHLSEYKDEKKFASLLYKTGFFHVDIRQEESYIAFICKK